MATILLSNPRHPELRPMQVEARVDTGAINTCIPQHIVHQLQLDEFEKREVVTAGGEKRICSYVGPLHVHFENRGSLAGALVLGDEVLLGAIQMEDMDVIISPRDRKLMVNPENPNFAVALVKSARGTL